LRFFFSRVAASISFFAVVNKLRMIDSVAVCGSSHRALSRDIIEDRETIAVSSPSSSE